MEKKSTAKKKTLRPMFGADVRRREERKNKKSVITLRWLILKNTTKNGRVMLPLRQTFETTVILQQTIKI